MDAMIAAITRSAGEMLITRHPAHFADIPEFAVESY
jgi:predicted nucleic acid-binding protein